ncbi:type II secretion system F family protein [Viridibacillus sp. YIM B01967]|uniref:Type II secretion system F family protein n=1 Tax=Viridibacillus soli TaxID=2798301 RepID=A0ABS1H4C8_9BACL|nr:type II secretion system F family protein [Viridibacillus soli]
MKKMSVLLEEGYTFRNALSMLLPHHVEEVSEVESLIEEKFRSGSNMSEILQLLGFQKNYLMTVHVAEQQGRVVRALDTIARQMKTKEETQKRLQKLMAYPAILFVFLVMLFFAFRTYFLPNMSSMMLSREGDVNMSKLTLSSFFLHIPDVLIIAACVSILFAFFTWKTISKKEVDYQMIVYLKIPILCRWFRLQLTRQFAYELGGLLESGLSMQDSLSILKQQDLQPFMAEIAGKIRGRVIFGESLSTAVNQMKIFQKGFNVYIVHGEEGGNLGRELQIYSDFLTDRTETNMTKLLAIVQPLLFCIIALCILGAYLAILLPMYEMMEMV